MGPSSSTRRAISTAPRLEVALTLLAQFSNWRPGQAGPGVFGFCTASTARTVTPTDPLRVWSSPHPETYTAQVFRAARTTSAPCSNWRARQAAAGRKEFYTASTRTAPTDLTPTPG